MGGMNKVLMSGDGKGGAIPYLPLDQVLKNRPKSGSNTGNTAAPQPGNNQQQGAQ